MRALLYKSWEETVLLAADGTIQDAIPAATPILGLEPDSVLGQSPIEFVHPEDRADFAQTMKELASVPGAAARRQYRLRHRDGSWRWVEATGTNLLHIPDVQAIVANFRDITETKRADDARQFLSEASAVLASSLDYKTTLEHVAHLVVPRLADWCSVTIIEPDGSVRPLVVAHVDPAREEWASEAQHRYPYDPDAPRGLANVLRTGQPELYPEISDALLAAGARDEAHLHLLRELRMTSAMLVPLVARERVLGAISLVSAESGIHYTERDLSLAQELARRASVAIDNARLYREAQEREATLRHFFDGAPMMMGIADVVGDDVLHVADNAMTERFFGRPRGSTQLCFASQMGVPADHIREWIAHYREAERTAGVVRFEYAHTTAGGARWLSASVSSIGRVEGGRLRCCYIVEDVTERRQADERLRETEERLRLAVESAEIGTWSFDPRTERLNWSDRGKAIFGLSADAELEYAGFLARLHPEDRERARRAVQEALEPTSSGDFRIESRLLWPDGSVRWIVARGRTFFAGAGEARHAERFTGTIVDITRRRLLEEQLRQRVDELAEADRRKDEFLSMLAHELRNPLGAISNALHVMQRARQETPAFERARESVARQIEHQTRLVDDLLDVSRITRGRLELRKERLDLARLVRETTEDYRSRLEGAALSVCLDLPEAPVPVLGDRTRLAQVLGNLLDNAAKYTPPGGEVAVRCRVKGVGGVVSVRDTGVGIEPRLLPHIFETFTQADRSLDRSQGGLGLGLALVKGLVELQGGTVGARSAGPGHGSELSFTLPIAEELPVLENAPLPSGATAEPLRVLIIEDNPDGAETLRDLLELLGNEVRLAYTGPQGLEAARQFRPQVVLCDIGLPGMDGYEVATALQRDPATAGARLVAVTGYGGEQDRRRSQSAGFEAHLTKPVDPERLQRLLAAGEG